MGDGMAVTIDEMNNDPLGEHLKAQGITASKLVAQLWEELHAVKTEKTKLKGAATIEEGQEHRARVVVRTDVVIHSSNGESDYSVGESLVQVDVIDWNTRREARRDAHRFLGHFPKETLNLDGDLGLQHNAKIDLNLSEFKAGLKRFIKNDG
jgi:hypothetical protein